VSRRWMKSWSRGVLVSGLAWGLMLAALPSESLAKKQASAQSAPQKKIQSASGKRRAATAPQARGGLTLKSKSAQTAAARKAVWTTRVVKGKRVRVAMKPVVLIPQESSVGRLSGLHAASDPLDLKSGVALVIDQDNNEVLLSKNSGAVLPIASITKLMTALVVIDSGASMDEVISIEQDDVEQTSNARSRLLQGTSMSRADMMRLALMSSENRAAHALSRNYPGGRAAFVAAMNHKARELRMRDTRFVESTGLSPENRSSAMDLTRLVVAASAHDLIREYSTAKESAVVVGGGEDRLVHFRSTNGLIGNPEWDISLQKTGYIAAAGRCLVMQAQLAGRRLIMVLLDSAGQYSRFGDAERIRKWITAERAPLSAAAPMPVLTLSR
jgi:serine-type D-Ala-D-Ala endopeptidase (penicillin-binding protein 7)